MLAPLNPVQLAEVVRIVLDWKREYLTARERDGFLAKYLTCTERYALRPLLGGAADGHQVEQLVQTATAGRTIPRGRVTRRKGGAP